MWNNSSETIINFGILDIGPMHIHPDLSEMPIVPGFGIQAQAIHLLPSLAAVPPFLGRPFSLG